MENRELAALTPRQYAALMIRIAVAVLYLCHALLMWMIFGIEHAAHYFASLALPAWLAYAIATGELAGAAMLLLGLYVRLVAVALLPVALGTALVHLGTGVGATLGYAAYLAGCLAGQALLASRTLEPRPDDGFDSPIIGVLRLRA